MQRWVLGIGLLTSTLSVAGATLIALAPTPSGATQEPQPIARYPLLADLKDATGHAPPVEAKNAPLRPGTGIYCNGLYVLESATGCDIRTPTLSALDLSAFTISAQFLVPPGGAPGGPLLVGGERYRWLFYRLGLGGKIELGFNSNHIVECSVKYRRGVWHEATITFDGRTATLYLDGVPGCHTDASLTTGNERTILVTNFGDATTFYGMLRDLRISNGVAIPVPRTPEADADAVPPPPDLAPVDQFLAKCPTRDEIHAVDADLHLLFDADPTSTEPLACSAAAGSRDLSPLKKRVYTSLLLMKRLQFDRPLPWTDKPLYKWLTGAIRGIRFRADVKYSSCCGPDRLVSIVPTDSILNYTDRWADPVLHGGLDGFVLVLVHEARHAEGHPHTCGTKDRTVEELGSWGVQYYLARWLVEHIDQAFFSAGGIDYTARLSREAENLRKGQICQSAE